jgi:hypothetical protein
MITIAKTSSVKSMTYWILVLFIKYGISVIVTPLKLLGSQFFIMAATATNELFGINLAITIFYYCLPCIFTPFYN